MANNLKSGVQIHQTAIVSPQASIGANVKIGPYSIVGDNVVLNDNVKLISHVCLDGNTVVGPNTIIFPFASIGHIPQDLKYEGEESLLIIGSNNIIREYVTMHPGTSNGNMKTVIGNDCLFMIGTHIAHDCIIGNNVIMANNTTLAGHVLVGDYAVFGGLSAVQQFIRIGKHAMIGGGSMVNADVIPYSTVYGNRANIEGTNIIGMKRRGFERKMIEEVLSVNKLIFTNSEKTFQERIASLAEQYQDNVCVQDIILFLRQDMGRPLCTPKNFNLQSDKEQNDK
jgi:UDP-N-acetylglucosamine acyltransferase